MTEPLTQNLTDIGLEAETDSVDPASYFGRIFDPGDKFRDLMIWERNSYVPDPDNMIGSMGMPTGALGSHRCFMEKASV